MFTKWELKGVSTAPVTEHSTSVPQTSHARDQSHKHPSTMCQAAWTGEHCDFKLH